jgi:serine/threonine protein kinase
MLPFATGDDDASNFVLFSLIKKGKYSFPDDVWADISREAKEFIAELLNTNPELRPKAVKALENKWLATKSKVDVLPNVRKNFDAKKTFKKAINAVRASLITPSANTE